MSLLLTYLPKEFEFWPMFASEDYTHNTKKRIFEICCSSYFFQTDQLVKISRWLEPTYNC